VQLHVAILSAVHVGEVCQLELGNICMYMNLGSPFASN
jgi:hypothetical protein